MKKRVLVVDDDSQLTGLVKMSLELNDFLVEEAWDGDKALRMMKKKAPDLLVLDLMMPRKDGWEILREVREDPGLAGVPVIMLTAVKSPSDAARAWEMGADGYVTKPFNPSSLTVRVRELLETTRGERQERRRSELDRLAREGGAADGGER